MSDQLIAMLWRVCFFLIPAASSSVLGNPSAPNHIVNNNGKIRVNNEYTGDVVVYGATAGGCIAAIAASRSGAKNVVLASPYKHVGGMTTGGIMHADVGNYDVIGGITLEYFDRVTKKNPPPSPSPSSPPQYGCISDRCVELAIDKSGSPDGNCSMQCAPLAATEWLAVKFLSTLTNGNQTLTVSLPSSQNTSYIKKTERLARQAPPGMSREVHNGQVFSLAKPAVSFDDTYYLIQLTEHQQHNGETIDSPSLLKQYPYKVSDAPPIHPGAPPGYLYQSHVAEQVLEDMLAEANVTIVRNLIGLANAFKNGTTLNSVVSETGVQLTGDVWIDGSYEGDLAYIGGADMTWGRESVEQYNESGAGRRPASIIYNVDPFWPDGSVIPHVSGAPLVDVGEADKRIEVYDFRLCFTNSPSHRIPFWKPDTYNASEWEFWRRLYKAKGQPKDLAAAGLGCLGPIPNNYTDCGADPCVKCDMLGMAHGTDMLNGAWSYPNGTTQQRNTIREAHIQYTLGLLWFWATDPSVGDAVHEEMATLGHCSDEYDADSTPPHWPYQLYVREARRLQGDFVWTEHDPPPLIGNHSVGLGAYSFDCHWVSLYVGEDNKTVEAEGRVNNGHNGEPNHGVGQDPFVIPYEVMLPKSSQLTNVLVPVAASSSHIRFNAIRMEPTWMIMGQSAGTAAAMSLPDMQHTSSIFTPSSPPNVHNVNITQLQTILVAHKQLIFP